MLGASQAQATSYVVSSAGIGSAGGLNGAVNYTLSSGSTGSNPENAGIGRIVLNGSDGTSLESFCVDVANTLGAGTFTSASLSSLTLDSQRNITAAQVNKITDLLFNVDSYIAGKSGLDTGSSVAERSAAAQMAVWEILFETSSVALNANALGDLSATASNPDANVGNFFISNSYGNDTMTVAALTDAYDLISKVTTGSWVTSGTSNSGFKVGIVRAASNQTQVVYGSAGSPDFFFLSAVPEPASWGMMVLGFGVIGSALRRKRVTFATIA